MSPARKAGREGGRSGRLARGPGSPGTRLSAGRRRRPPPAGPCARGCAESPPPGTLRTSEPFPAGWARLELPTRQIFVSPWVKERGSGSQLVWALGAQPWGVGGNPQPNRLRPRHHQELLAPGTLCPRPHAHPCQDTVSTSRPLWDTPRDTQRHTLACGPSPSPSDACTLHPRCTFAHHWGTHTFHPWYTHFCGHTLIPQGRQHRSTHAGTAYPGHSQSRHRPRPGTQVAQTCTHCCLGHPTLHRALCSLPAMLIQTGQGPGTP